MAETAVLGVGRNEIPPYYTELSKSTVQFLLTSATKVWRKTEYKKRPEGKYPLWPAHPDIGHSDKRSVTAWEAVS